MSDVQLILREDVMNLGEAGDLVRVKPGYARNFLVPQGKADLATESNLKRLEHQKRVISEKLAKDLKDVKAVAGKFKDMLLEIEANAGPEGKLFGSVTAAQISQLLAERGIEIDRRRITLAEPIRSVGEHTVSLKLHRDFSVDIKIQVHGTESPQQVLEEVEEPEAGRYAVEDEDHPDDLDPGGADEEAEEAAEAEQAEQAEAEPRDSD